MEYFRLIKSKYCPDIPWLEKKSMKILSEHLNPNWRISNPSILLEYFWSARLQTKAINYKRHLCVLNFTLGDSILDWTAWQWPHNGIMFLKAISIESLTHFSLMQNSKSHHESNWVLHFVFNQKKALTLELYQARGQ